MARRVDAGSSARDAGHLRRCGACRSASRIPPVRGTFTKLGSRAFRWLVTPYDDPLAARPRGGTVFVGKTATSELGMSPITEPDIHEATRNRKATRTPEARAATRALRCRQASPASEGSAAQGRSHPRRAQPALRLQGVARDAVNHPRSSARARGVVPSRSRSPCRRGARRPPRSLGSVSPRADRPPFKLGSSSRSTPADAESPEIAAAVDASRRCSWTSATTWKAPWYDGTVDDFLRWRSLAARASCCCPTSSNR